MRAMTALIKREFLEHRGAFLYAPAVLLAIVSTAIVFAVATGNTQFDSPAEWRLSGAEIYRVGIGGAFLLWSAYLMIGLFFYYADSFSADRRNNALLFWKSMPQSDLKVLAAKALSGITIFLGLIFSYAMLTAVLVYLVLLMVSAQHPVIAAPSPIEAALSFVQMGVVGAVYLVLTLLWHAPGLAWVAGLSTLFRRWSIPLAFLIPGTVILLEFLNSLRGTGGGRPIADFLTWRLDGFNEEVGTTAGAVLMGQAEGGPFTVLGLMLSDIDWLHMGIGLIFTAAVVYLASEYRRRRIEA